MMTTAAEQGPKTRDAVALLVGDLAPYDIEMHVSVNPDLPKKYGKAIKEAGGSYSAARGNGCLCRFVTLPRAARKLINAIAREFAFWEGASSGHAFVMIARPAHNNLPAPVAVVNVRKAVCDFDALGAFEDEYARRVINWRAAHGDLGPITNAEVAAKEKAEIDARAIEVEKRKVAQILHAAMPRSLDEHGALMDALTQYIENSLDVEDTMDPADRTKLEAARKLLQRTEETFIKLTTE